MSIWKIKCKGRKITPEIIESIFGKDYKELHTTTDGECVFVKTEATPQTVDSVEVEFLCAATL